MNAINANALFKQFGNTIALNGLDLHVSASEVHGFLGSNGAGKSTTIRALLGQLRLNGGAATIFGHDVWREQNAIHRRIAYVPGDVALWPSLTGGECIDVLARFQGTGDKARRDQLIERFQLDPTKKSRTYSKGNRQKVALCAALSTHADLLILDEPTSGLDPLMEVIFQDCIREARDEGRTILLSSHILAEVEALCDRVSIVRQGKVISTGPLDVLMQGTRTQVRVVTARPVPGLQQLVDLSNLHETSHEGSITTAFRVANNRLVDALAVVTAANPTSLTVEPPSLDELFMDFYREESA